MTSMCRADISRVQAMASFFSFHLAVALLLVLVHQQAAGEPDNFDLDKAVERTVKRRAKIYKMKAIWWDMYRKRDEVKTYGYAFPPVTATAGDVEYGGLKSSAKRPRIVYTKWFRNGQASLSKKATVKKKVERKKTATWHVEAGFSYSGSVTASASMNSVNIVTQHQISLDLKGGHREEVSATETFSINHVFIVPPMKSVKIEWIITDDVKVRYAQNHFVEKMAVTGIVIRLNNAVDSEVKEVFWTSPVTVTGYFFVKYRVRHRKKSGFLSISSLNFLSKDDRFKRTGNNTYLYTAKGSFMVVKTLESRVRVTEYDYHACGGNSFGGRDINHSLSLTPYTPTAETL